MKEKLGLQLEKADDDVQNPNNEKLTDQNEIINLQNRLSQTQEEQLPEWKTTVLVATKIKSYSAAMWKIFVTVFALKKIQANVQKVADTGERS